MSKEANELKEKINRYEQFFKKRYKILYTLNDFIIGVLFFVGSFFFFFDQLEPAGIWLFAIGSLQLLIRPTIRLIHDVHYRRHIKHQYRYQPPAD
ncbi:YrhK family protein [Bacillus swezeyi]|uniref:YrhK family protein n=1 Tax=Bacillus swezeyi TaxID=1925020 RepID=UPI003F894C84